MVNSSFTTNDPLVSFLYELIRDYVCIGDIEKVVQNSTSNFPHRLTNKHLGEYCQELVERLKV
jgi:hypothetical protein